MIFITGDTHGSQTRMDELISQMRLYKDREKYLIICGDFGFVFYDNEKEKQFLDKLETLKEENIYIAFCDGNHENFSALNRYPVTEWRGGCVHRIRANVIHLMRGEIFRVENKKLFVFGGAYSVDKEYRLRFEREHGSPIWWADELPSREDLENARYNLIKHDLSVDYVISHTCPGFVQKEMVLPRSREELPLNLFFSMIGNECTFLNWFFGHYHIDESSDLNEKQYTAVYQKTICIE